jgi:hypothetical protein
MSNQAVVMAKSVLAKPRDSKKGANWEMAAVQPTDFAIDNIVTSFNREFSRSPEAFRGVNMPSRPKKNSPSSLLHLDIETAEIMADPDFLSDFRKGVEQLAAGKRVSLEELEKELGL